MAHPEGTLDAGAAKPTGRTLRLSIPAATWVLIFAGVVAIVAISALISRAQRPLGWALTAVVIAAALEPAVSWLDQRIPRALAVIGTLVGVLAVAGGIFWLTLNDLDDQFQRLQRAIPEAASEIEASSRFGEAARDFDLVGKAREFASGLRSPSATAGSDAAATAGGAVVVLILTLFMLTWGKRLFAAASREIDDPARRTRIAHVVDRAFRGSQRYVNVVVAAAVVVFGVTFGVYSLIDLPGAAPLSLVAGVASTVPTVGLFLGVVPAAALHAGLQSPWEAVALLAGAAIAQLVQQRAVDHFTRGIVARPGSAVMLVSFIVGYDLYGVGGALVGTALMVFATSLVDARSSA